MVGDERNVNWKREETGGSRWKKGVLEDGSMGQESEEMGGRD